MTVKNNGPYPLPIRKGFPIAHLAVIRSHPAVLVEDLTGPLSRPEVVLPPPPPPDSTERPLPPPPPPKASGSKSQPPKLKPLPSAATMELDLLYRNPPIEVMMIESQWSKSRDPRLRKRVKDIKREAMTGKNDKEKAGPSTSKLSREEEAEIEKQLTGSLDRKCD